MTDDPYRRALARLHTFRAGFAEGDVIDEASGLTAADLGIILAAAKPQGDLEPGGSLGVDDLGNLA